ncbi:ATP-binding protein [Micromonospora sp. KLBMP9576]|uniref:ATP-binding protein n=1 Tax=Micromonospora sp. KLBMP9576 TaxID=3424769 RepID=UPI003D8CE525
MSAELILLSRVTFRGREITGPRLRGLLALLADHFPGDCAASRLIDALWPHEQPRNPTKALQILVSRARAQLGGDVIATTATGYRLSLGEQQVDAAAVVRHGESAERSARAGDHTAALAHADAGLALWSGPPTDDPPGADPLAVLRADRVRVHRSLRRSRALALSRLGRHAEALSPLDALATRSPRDEEILGELLRCESATRGPSVALARYERYRRALRDDLGADPGPALRQLHRTLLGGEAAPAHHHVPHEPNPLLGRDEDLAAVAGLLRASRVTTVVGPGGLGKTRLAYAVARRAEQRVVRLVPLAGITADADVAAEVAAALGVGEARNAPAGPAPVAPDAVAAIVGALGPGPVLLVLDNCEQVVRGVADLVGALVAATSDLRVLATGRTPLGLSSESVHPLPELAPPAAVELFTQRARAARPGAGLPAEAVADLCRRLDGLPLAIELAAARVRAMTVPEIARRLDDRFALLRGGPRDAPQRHHTLHDVVAWSWNLLGPDGQAAMRALSVFPGGFGPPAAARLLGRTDVTTVLEHLVDQSLLRVEETPAGARFRMLETVREFAGARRAESGDADGVRAAFLGWARDFGLAHHESLLGATAFAAAGLVRAEQDNLVQALRYAVADNDGPTVAATSAVLAALWTMDVNHSRMLTLAEETGPVLSHFRPPPPFVAVTRTVAALCVAHTFMVLGPHATRALATLRRLPSAPPDTVVGALCLVLGAVPEISADRAVLTALCDAAAPAVAGVANCLASYLLEQEGAPGEALVAARRMLTAVHGQPLTWLRVLAHARVGELCLGAELGHEARRNLTAALDLLTGSGPWLDVHQIRWTLVLVNLQLGALDEARHWAERATFDRADHTHGMGAFEWGIRAELALAGGDVDAGLRLWGRAADHPVEPAEAVGEAPWMLEVHAACVVAHARNGRLDLVEGLADELARTLVALLDRPMADPPAFLMQRPICGALLLALGTVDLARARRGDERRQLAAGARLVALAERFHHLRSFQPTMSSATARAQAREADAAAYDEASSSYAALGHDDLRAVALAAVRGRP